ncbi:MAG: hypothetical protein IJD77_02025 [Clostridia bacterium]|nr:hypothetical protein [Clostridia bacterium]
MMALLCLGIIKRRAFTHRALTFSIDKVKSKINENEREIDKVKDKHVIKRLI